MKALVLLAAAVLAWGAYERSGESVIDTETTLQWEDSRQNEIRESVWRDAKKYCASLDLEGFHDWRLPTREELQKLVRASEAGEVHFEHGAVNGYWTSEVNRKMPINAFVVFSGNGHIYDTDRCDEEHVRCVRDR